MCRTDGCRRTARQDSPYCADHLRALIHAAYAGPEQWASPVRRIAEELGWTGRVSRAAADLPPAAAPATRLGDRFWSKVDRSGACWLWTAATREGYGAFMVTTDGRHRVMAAHRLSYEDARGPIPADLEPDHLCRNRACVKPAHLELVTHRVNSLRGGGVGAANARKTHCPQGHPYDAGNTLHLSRNGWRKCRACHRRASTKAHEASAATRIPSRAVGVAGTE